MNEIIDKEVGNPNDLQHAKDLYSKIVRVTDKGNDAIVKKKKDGRLYVYEGNLRLAK